MLPRTYIKKNVHFQTPFVEQTKMSRIRQKIAQRLKDAQNTCAMLTTFNEVDMR